MVKFTTSKGKKRKKQLEWRCSECNKKLALSSDGYKTLKVKHKDLYITIHSGTGGWLEVICPRCGECNRVNDTQQE